jgi:plasmid replication initiation protein
MKNRGTNDIPRELKFQPHDLLKAIARSTGGRDYAQLRDSLDRLKTTAVTTNMRVKRGQKTSLFSWIDGWEDLIGAQTKESRGITLTVSDWFYRGVTEDGGVLSIDPSYFLITGGRERWLYRVARKHAGGNGPDGFAISMPVLFDKSGAEGTYRRFKFEILRIIQRNDLPGISLSVRSEKDGEPLVHMVKREYAGEGNNSTGTLYRGTLLVQAPHCGPRLPAHPISRFWARSSASYPSRQLSISAKNSPTGIFTHCRMPSTNGSMKTARARPKITRPRSMVGCASTTPAIASGFPDARS